MLENFNLVKEQMKSNYFYSNTPHYDQVAWLKELHKPKEMTWKDFVVFVYYVKQNLCNFPLNLEESRDP